MTYVDTLAAWQDFFITAAAAAATLAGLLFVGLSIHIQVVVGQPDVRSLARLTLTDFFSVLVLGLLILAPIANDSPNATAVSLIVVGAVRLVLTFRPARDAIRQRRARTIGIAVLLIRFGTSGLATIGMLAVAWLLTEGLVKEALIGFLSIVITLLVVAVRNTWDLLVTVAAKTQRHGIG